MTTETDDTKFVAERRATPEEVKPALILETALQYIDTYGWKQHTYGAKWEGFCLMGAVQEAWDDLAPKDSFGYIIYPGLDHGDPKDRALDYILGCLPERTFETEDWDEYYKVVDEKGEWPKDQDIPKKTVTAKEVNIPEFNDRPETTEEDARAALECAVASAKSAEADNASAN